MIIFVVVGVVIIGVLFLTRGYMSTTARQLLGASEFVTALSAHPGAILIDVRTLGEYTLGHMRGAQNIDIQSVSFANEIAKLDVAGTYFVYCHSGRRSAAAVSLMKQKGLTNIYELAGGVSAAPQLMTER